MVADSKQQNRASVKKAATQQKSEVDRESVIRGAYDKVNSSPEALDKVISEMRADGINIETLMATERERILGSLSRAYSEAKYSSMQGDNRGIISYLEAVETAAKDPNYIKRLIAAEYLAQKQLASSDHSASTAIESRSADVSAAADISYTEQTSNPVENISVDNSAENGIIETRKNFTTERVETEIFWCKKPHTNRTPGHWETICDEVELMKQSGKYVRIYANKKLSNEVSHPIPNRRPDIMAVRHDGLIDQVEVPSKTDKVYLLDIRMRDNQRIFGDRAGKTKIRYIDQKGETLWIK